MVLQRDAKAAEGRPIEELTTTDAATGLKILPHWLAQPYFRPTPTLVPDGSGKKVKARAGESSSFSHLHTCWSYINHLPEAIAVLHKRSHSERTPEPENETADDSDTKRPRLEVLPTEPLSVDLQAQPVYSTI